MADKTKIEWCTSPDGSLGASWNPVGGCSVASRGCEGCYAAERVAPRQQAQGHPVYDGVVKKTKAGIYRFTGKMTAAPDDHKVWTQPLRWRKPRRIFVCSTSDLFHEHRPIADIDRVFAAMALAPHHRYLLLTKRARVMREYIERKRRSAPEWISLPKAEGKVLLPYEGGWPSFVWLGVSVEDQQRADERIPDLLATPAALRFLSVEPMLDFVDLDRGGFSFLHRHKSPSGTKWPPVDLVIAGGESGSRSRPTPEGAFEALRDQCAAAGVPFFMKQMQNKAPIPEHLQIRQWPQEQSHQ